MSADDRLEKVPEVVSALRSISTGHALSNDLCMDMGWRRVCSLGADLLERLAATEARLVQLQAENDALRAQPGVNDPLTLEELRGMDGEPVYCKDYECWGIVSVEEIGSWAGKPYLVGKNQLVHFDYDIKRRKLTLYRRKPEEV